MPKHTFNLEIITPEKVLVSEEIDSFEAPGVEAKRIRADDIPNHSAYRVFVPGLQQVRVFKTVAVHQLACRPTRKLRNEAAPEVLPDEVVGHFVVQLVLMGGDDVAEVSFDEHHVAMVGRSGLAGHAQVQALEELAVHLLFQFHHLLARRDHLLGHADPLG